MIAGSSRGTNDVIAALPNARWPESVMPLISDQLIQADHNITQSSQYHVNDGDITRLHAYRISDKY